MPSIPAIRMSLMRMATSPCSARTASAASPESADEAGQPLGLHDPHQRVANLGVVVNDEALCDGGGNGGIGGVRHRWKVRPRGAILNAMACRNAFSPIRFLHLNRCDP